MASVRLADDPERELRFLVACLINDQDAVGGAVSARSAGDGQLECCGAIRKRRQPLHRDLALRQHRGSDELGSSELADAERYRYGQRAKVRTGVRTRRRFPASLAHLTRHSMRVSCSHAVRSGGGRIRTYEGGANGFTARPLWPLGNSPAAGSV